MDVDPGRAAGAFEYQGRTYSFCSKGCLEKFRADLTSFIRHALQQKYNGQSAPRLVLFSPIAHEDLHSRNLPSGKENNPRLELYTRAMSEVAAAHRVTFVDLFHPSQQLYGKTKQPLTVNGVHLNEAGNRLVAELVDRALFGAAKYDAKSLEKVRQAQPEIGRRADLDHRADFAERRMSCCA